MSSAGSRRALSVHRLRRAKQVNEQIDYLVRIVQECAIAHSFDISTNRTAVPADRRHGGCRVHLTDELLE